MSRRAAPSQGTPRPARGWVGRRASSDPRGPRRASWGLHTCAATAAGTEATETDCKAAMAVALSAPLGAAAVLLQQQARRRLCASR